MAVKIKPDPPGSRITIFADASWCPETKAGGWGAWYKADGMERGAIIGSQFYHRMHEAYQAEAAGLYYALRKIQATGLFNDVSIAQLQLDNLRVLSVVLQHVQHTKHNPHAQGADAIVKPLQLSFDKLSVPEMRMVRLCNSLRRKCGVQFQVRHVRGHKQGEGRNWVNRTCDRQAKKYMRQARDRLGPLP